MIEQEKIRVASGTLKIKARIKDNIVVVGEEMPEKRCFAHLTCATDNCCREVLRQTLQTV